MNRLARMITAFFLVAAMAGSSFAAHTVTLWPENRKGAVSLAFDDGCQSHASLGVPALDARGMKGTFFLVIDSIGDYSPAWSAWKSAANSGHEIASHTMTHPWLTDLSPSQLQYELGNSKAAIDSQVLNQKCLTLSYPYGAVNSSVASAAQGIYIASRGISCGLNGEPYDFSNVKACSPDDGDDIYARADAAESQRKWLVAFIHSLDGGRDCWGSWEIDMWTTYLDYLKGKDLWVGTFGAAVKYIKERASATITVLSTSSDQIVLNLTDSLSDSIYDQPLTIRSDVPSDWITATVQQGSGGTIEVTTVLEGTARVIYYSAIPDRGMITLKNPLVRDPQIASLSPQQAIVGGAGFTLTVNGDRFVSGSKVRWNGSDRATTFVSATQLRATIPASDVAATGTFPVTVQNPDGGLSNAVSFDVRNPVPSVTGLNPDWASSGGSAFTLTVDGGNFVSGSRVRWNGSNRTTTFVSGTELTASISAADIAAAGTINVTVNNPAPGGGTSSAAAFDVLPVLVSLTLTPSSVIGGTGSTGRVTMSGPARAGGAVVTLSSDNTAAATVPASVAVAAGATSATFPVATYAVASSSAAVISGLYGGVTKSSTLTVLPEPVVSLVSLSLAPSSVIGGIGSTGTVTLDIPARPGGAVVSLASDNTSAATVPASVTVAAGATSATFPVATSPVLASTAVSISGLYGGVNKSSTLAVLPVPPVTLASLSLNPASVVGGTGSTGTVTLDIPAYAGGAVVFLASDNTSAATVPASVTVAAGATTATFPVATLTVPVSTVVTISGLYGGVTRSSTLTVLYEPPVTLASLALSPSSVVEGSGSTGTVTLDLPARAGGAVVPLTSYNPSAATVPASVTVAAGAASATFPVTTHAVSASTSVTISGAYGGVERSQALTVLNDNPNPTPGHSVTTWPQNRRGAVSLTFDDGYASQYTLGVPALNARGMGASFYLITEYSGPLSQSEWNSWRNAASAGHEIGSHTLTHPYLTRLPLSEARQEIEASKAEIDAQIPSQKVRTFVYPYGDLNPEIVSIVGNSYIAARGISCDLNDAPFDFYNVRACTPEGDDLYALSNAAEQDRKWLVAYFHSLAGATEVDWGTYEIGMFTAYLDYLKNKNIWVGTFGAAVKYIKERTSATVSVLSSSSDELLLNVRDAMDDAIYDQPLTLRSEVPSGWTSATVQQGSGPVTEVATVLEGTARVVYYNAVPDRGVIALRNPDANLPKVTALAPQFVTVGSPPFTLAVTGSRFVTGSRVRWNGSDRATTFVSATQLQASISAADIAAAGVIPVTVQNPDGGLSNAMNFEVRVLPPAVADLDPSVTTAGGSAFPLTVYGSNFLSGARVRWNGSNRTTTFVSATQLQASITATDIASPGTIPVTVLNPDGGVSNAMDFEVWGPPPVVAGLSPSFATAGGSAFTLTVNGSKFVSGAKVRWNGSNRTTTFVSTTQLRASITAADIVSPGTIPVTVLNPDGGVSNAMSFTVRAPSPAVTSLSPSFATAGSPAFTLTVNGTNFVSGARVRWNGSDRATTFVSATLLQASITATDIATGGTIPVTVQNPDGGASNTVSFAVWSPAATYTDNFNRVNESPIGGNWTTFSHGGSYVILRSNQMQSNNGTWNAYAWRRNATFTTNQWSQARLTSILSSSEAGGPTVRGRLNNSEWNGYMLAILSSSAAVVYTTYNSAGSGEQIGAVISGTFAQNDVMGLSIIGNVLYVSQNGLTIATRTDANNRIPTGGAPGVMIKTGTFDDWQGGGTN